MANKKAVKFEKLRAGNKFICPDTTELSGVDRTYIKLGFLVTDLPDNDFASPHYNAVDLRCGIPVVIPQKEEVIVVDF